MRSFFRLFLSTLAVACGQSNTCPQGEVPLTPRIFAYSGGVQNYAVPPSSTSLVVQLWGGGGGGSGDTATAHGGGGAYVAGIIPRVVLNGAAFLLVAVGGGGPFPSGGASATNTPALGGALRGLADNDDCAAEGAGPSALAVMSNYSTVLIAVAGAGGGAGETSSGGAASFFGAGQSGANPPFPTNFDRFTNTYNSGGEGGSFSQGGGPGLGFDANCEVGFQTNGTGPFSFTSPTAVSVTAGLSLCSCGGVGGGGYFGGGPGGWWCGGGGGSSFLNMSMFPLNATGEGGDGNLPGGRGEENYVPGSGVGASDGLRKSGGNGSVVITACVSAPTPSATPSSSSSPASFPSSNGNVLPEYAVAVVSTSAAAIVLVFAGLAVRDLQRRHTATVDAPALRVGGVSEPFLYVGDGS